MLIQKKILGLAYPVIRHPEDPHFVNLAEGEIVKMGFSHPSELRFGQQIVGSKDGFDWIWIYLGDNYCKVIGKFPESPWTCQ